MATRTVRGFHGHIAAMMGATVAQLDYMLGLKAGISRLRGTEGVATDAKGWTHSPNGGKRELTPEGLEVVRKARALGY